jgi:hypothetical protein
MTMLWIVFTVSASSKVRSAAARRAFSASLRAAGLVAPRLAGPVAVAIGVAESGIMLGLGWAVVSTVAPLPGGYQIGFATLSAAALVLAVLSCGVALALRRGTNAHCACFGATERPLRGLHLVRNGVLLLVAASALVFLVITRGDDVESVGAVLGMTSGAIAGAVVIRLDDVVDLFIPPRTAGPDELRASQP